jgi:hypothetical protein
MHGVVRLSLNFVFENTVKLPMQNEGVLEYVNKINTKVVQRTVRSITEGHIFGFEEVVNLQRNRVFMAVAGGNPVTCLYINRDKFLSYCTSQHIVEFIQQCQEYTDFVKEGKELYQQLRASKNKTENVLNAIGRNLKGGKTT